MDEPQRRVDVHFASHVTDWASIYQGRDLWAIVHQQRRAVALSWIDEIGLPPGARIVEVGCGAGLTTAALAERGLVIAAVDAVAGMVERTRQTAREAGVSDRVTTVLGDAHRLAYPDHTFRLALALGVIPWLHSPRRALAEMARVVEPGGYVLVTADNRWRLNHVLDPWLSPALGGVRRAAGVVLRSLGRRPRKSSEASAHMIALSDFDSWLEALELERVRSVTLGFGPFSLFGRAVFSDSLGQKVHHTLQSLADRGVPGVRSTGAQYLVLARKAGAE